jgi:uncharacterized protein YciI
MNLPSPRESDVEPVKLVVMDDAGSGPRVHFVAFHSPGPAWQDGTALFEQPGVEDHAAYYEGELETGRLESGGPLTDPSGGMAISRADVDRTRAEDIARAGPAVVTGLLRVEVKAWLNALTRWR